MLTVARRTPRRGPAARPSEDGARRRSAAEEDDPSGWHNLDGDGAAGSLGRLGGDLKHTPCHDADRR